MSADSGPAGELSRSTEQLRPCKREVTDSGTPAVSAYSSFHAPCIAFCSSHPPHSSSCPQRPAPAVAATPPPCATCYPIHRKLRSALVTCVEKTQTMRGVDTGHANNWLAVGHQCAEVQQPTCCSCITLSQRHSSWRPHPSVRAHLRPLHTASSIPLTENRLALAPRLAPTPSALPPVSQMWSWGLCSPPTPPCRPSRHSPRPCPRPCPRARPPPPAPAPLHRRTSPV